MVQGTDNGIYHKAFTSAAWSNSWDSPIGATSSKPAAAFYFTHVCLDPSCVTYDDQFYLFLVVRGTDNGVYFSSFFIGGGWGVWVNLSGATLSAPTLTSDANGCNSASTVVCTWTEALAVRGTDNAVYHKRFSGFAFDKWSAWDSPGAQSRIVPR